MAQSGNIQDALEALRNASKLMPDDSSALVEIGLIQLRRRAPEAAIQAFQKAKDRGSSTYRLHTSFAKALMMRERYAEAIDELKTAVMHKPDSAEAYYRLGTALDHDKRYEEAIEAFSAAIELAPQEVEYLQALGFTLESAGRRKEAIKCFKRALDLEHRSEVA